MPDGTTLIRPTTTTTPCKLLRFCYIHSITTPG
ncbi:hypothetical protein CKO_02814 [Citrobacter koseri ATCC BAA-895]|uniref:Uncharacterized protein n=1 Tax=Citrobacter koseri (strain ATCC BAA-895 / CDC 4225-83 / SGSC4696) TaxID=290338 RepID=A8AKA7_CITK8|nr:hypothetical protein CKO_02814 [Citrobacter koseri ATCC BAA-895]